MDHRVKRVLRAILRAAKAIKAAATATVRKHPKLTAMAVAGLVNVALPCVAVGITVGVLNRIGFGVAGVTGGTLAAGAQAGIGNVAAHSFFATATSAAVGGYGVGAITGVVQLVGGITAVVAGAAIAIKSWFRRD